MAKAYVNGEMVDVPDPTKKTINRPAPESVKKAQRVRVSATPDGRTTRNGVKSPKQITKPSVKAPAGFSRGGMGTAPRVNPVGKVPALGAMGGGMMVSNAAELLDQMTPEGYGSKAGYGNEQSPRDFNNHQGPLGFLGGFGEGVDALASGAGQAIGELSTYLPEALGGIRQADGSVPKVDTGGQQLPEEWYQDRYGQSREGYGYLASGSEAPLPSSPALPPMEMRPSHGPGMTSQNPIEVSPDGTVKANSRYGMPEQPDMKRRELDERFGDVTGGAIPDSMEGFMVANFLQNQLRMDDSRRVGDNKDIYKADLGALPNFMGEDRQRQMMPSEIESKTAYARQANALADNAPTDRDYKEAQTAQTRKQTENMLTSDQAMSQATDTDLRSTAASLAKDMLKNQTGMEPDPIALADQTAAIYAMLRQRHAEINKGAKPQMSKGTPDTAWFSDNSTPPALEWNLN